MSPFYAVMAETLPATRTSSGEAPKGETQATRTTEWACAFADARMRSADTRSDAARLSANGAGMGSSRHPKCSLARESEIS